MSGGYFNYTNDYVCSDITGEYPDYGLNKLKREQAKVRKKNALEDHQISELVYDVFCLIHSFDWYKSCDTDEEQYREDVAFFKKKWFSADQTAQVKKAIDLSLADAKEELLKEFNFLMEG